MGYGHVSEEKSEYRLHIRNIKSAHHSPGTETKVTPEIEAPIIPKETIYQGDWFSPLKNAAFDPPLRPVIRAISNNTAK